MTSLFDHINKRVVIIATIIFVVLIGGFIYYLVTNKSSDTVVLTRVDTSPLDATLGRELLSTLARLKSTTIDKSIFDDPVFATLQDFGVTIASQPVGRRNPFAPLSGNAPAGKTPSKQPALPKDTAPGASAKKTTTPPADEPDDFSGFDVE